MSELLQQVGSILGSPGFYAAAIRLATPVLLTAIGCLLCERAGIMNIASEGWMLIGAMTAVTATYFVGNPWLGLLCAMAAGGVSALLFAFFVIRIGTDQIVTAVALNVFALGATSIIFRSIFGPMSVPPEVTGLPVWEVPGLSAIPVVGRVLFAQSPIVYLAFLLVPLAHFMLFRTTWGLKIRAAGESPLAADTVGVNVFRIRYLTILVGGLAAGLGGAFLSIGQTTIFQEGMTAGRGFIAYTAIVYGRWMPVGTMIGTLIYGLAESLQLRIQALGIGIPYQFSLMIPYVLTIAAIVLSRRRAAWPAAYGVPYRRERRRSESAT